MWNMTTNASLFTLCIWSWTDFFRSLSVRRCVLWVFVCVDLFAPGPASTETIRRHTEACAPSYRHIETYVEHLCEKKEKRKDLIWQLNKNINTWNERRSTHTFTENHIHICRNFSLFAHFYFVVQRLWLVYWCVRHFNAVHTPFQAYITSITLFFPHSCLMPSNNEQSVLAGVPCQPRIESISSIVYTMIINR